MLGRVEEVVGRAGEGEGVAGGEVVSEVGRGSYSNVSKRWQREERATWGGQNWKLRDHLKDHVRDHLRDHLDTVKV